MLTADAADRNTRDWERLQMLLERTMPAISKEIEQCPKTVLLTHAGLFARYQQMHTLDRLRSQVGTATGPKGLWILIPGDSSSLASLGGSAIPMVNPAQFERLNEPWLKNEVTRQPATR